MAEYDPLTIQDPSPMGDAHLADDASMQQLNAIESTSNMGAAKVADEQSMESKRKQERVLAKNSLDQKELYKLYPTLQDSDDIAPGISDTASVMLNLSYRMGRPLDDVMRNYEEYKTGYARNKGWDATISESGMRSKFQEEFKVEDSKQTALNELYGNVVLKAFQDTGMGKNRAMVGLPTEYVKEWETNHKDLIDSDTAYHAQANRVYNQTLKDIESIRGKGAETFSALMDFTQGKADNERITQVAEHLATSSPEERQKVYRYIGLAAEAGHIDRGGIEQFAINMGQSFTRGFDFIPQGTLQGQEDAFREMRDTLATGKVWLRKADGTPTLNDVFRPSQAVVGSAINIDMTGREATPEEVATLKAQAESGLKTFGVIRELRNVAKTEVDPIRPVFDNSAIERGAYGLAGSLGIMVPVAINPMIGTLAYQAQEYDRIMLENPDINPKFAQGLALFEGAGNAALDRLQLGAINGKLPVFGGLLNGIKNNGIRRVLTTVGVEVLEQNLQEGAQDLIAPLTETLTAALREDMPDKDFGELMKDYVGSRAETFFAVLPLALLGGGIGTYRDLKNPAMQMADRQLAMAGFGPAQRDYINQASSLEEKATRVEQEWSKRTETDITAGKEQLAASIAEARAKQGGDTVEVNTKTDGSNEWIVRDPAGKEVARVASEVEAVTIIADRGEAEIKSQANVVADLLDSDWRKDKLPNFEAQFGGEVTPEQLLKDAEAKGDTKLVESIKASIEAHGNDPKELSKLRILGESWVTPYAEGQYKAFVKLNEGSTAQDAFEEIVHNIFDIDIAEGRITKEQAREWVSQTAAAGVAKYKFGTDAEVRESMAQIAQDFARNKLDQTNLPSSFVAFLKKLYTEFVEFMRRAKLLDQAFADGKIDADFERYLMGKIGLSDASMIEREVNRIEGEQGGSQQIDLFQDSRATPEAGADVRTVGDTKIVGPTSFAIRAFHGTPHEVDEFSTEKIGTGEGAQVYGWGLYFARNREVADHYRESLSPYTFHEGERELHGNEAWAAQFLINNGKDKAKAIDNADWVVANARDKAEVIQYIQKLSDADTRQNEGNLYGVTIDAEDHELLDWDKPLSEQPKEFQQTLREMWARSAKSFPALDPNGNPVAGQIYHIYEQHRGGNSEAVSQELNEAGIKGIRYLDNGSRGAYTAWQIELEGKHKGKWAVFQGSTSIGEYFDSEDAAKTHVAHLERQNTHNFVIFDGKHIQITEKNGQPVSVEDVPVDGGKSFSIRARDEAYDAAVKSGDEAEQQRLVDEAAKEAGYGVGPVYHGTNTEINQFDKKKAREGRIGKGFYFTPNRESAENYAADSVRMKGGEPVVKGYYLKDPNSYMDSIYVATDPSQIKSADPITRDDAGNVIPLSQRFNPESNDIRFSIQSQEQIDRVNKAVADTTQFAEGRMALYERAKERFKAVLAENKDILDALKEGGAAPEKIRRAKLIQGIAELEVILRQLPAEVRGKVGGFGVLARGGTGDAALAGFFKNRLQIIDRELEKYLAKEYLEKIETTLQNAKPRKGDNGVKKSTLGAVVQEFADKAYAASLLDNDATVDQLESLEKKIAKADDPKKEADLVEEWAITNTFGALAEQSSSKLKTALDYLKKEIAGGRAARKAAEQARIDDIRAKQGVISDALPGWTDSGLNKVNSPGWWEETKDLARQMVWSHASYEQILRRILPPEAQGIVEEWSNRIRRANGKTEAAALKNWQNLIQAIQSGFGGKGFMKTADALSELGEKREGKVSKLEGRQVELESIPIDKAEQLVRGEMNRGDYTKADLKQIEDALIAMPIESRKKYISIYRVIEEGRTESIPMTFDEMIFTTMAWDQTDVRVKMENSGWTQESYDQMVKEIASSKVATAVRDYLKDFYRNSTKEINPVYSRMFGMGLPDNPDYAPTSYESRKASGEMSPDGSAAQNTTTPGFAKARVTHNEAFKITPATQIYQQRSAEQAQWVAFAELHREMSAVLNSKNVRLSMKQENGKRLSELMSQVLDNIAKGGGVNTDAAYMKKWLGAATSGTAVASMSYNLKTIFNQFDAVTRFLYAMPLKDVMRAISNPQKVLESVPKSWESEVVQNRVLQGSNPAARFALKQAGMTPGKFLSAWYGTGAAGLMPMQYADGALTSLSSAMVYSDAHAKALAAGLSEKDADARALDAMDAAIWRFSQPVMFSAKSPVENNSGATMKLLYMFASDARLKTGILIDAVQSIKDGKGSKADHFRRIGVVFLGAMLAQTVSNIYRDIFSDDDDDEIWTAAGYGKAAALAPFQGFFLLGTAIDVALSSLTGQRAYSNSSNPLVNAGNNAIVAGKHASDILQTDDMEAFFKELGRIARAISLTPVTAVPAAVLNPVKPIVGAKKNLDKGSD